MHKPNLQSVALAVLEIIAIAVLGWVANPQSWEREAVDTERETDGRHAISIPRYALVR